MKRQDLTDTVKCTLNLPREVHSVAATEAKERNMSLNLFLFQLVSEAMPRPKQPPRKQPA